LQNKKKDDGPAGEKRPSMSDVLAGLGSVKLKSVQRSVARHILAKCESAFQTLLSNRSPGGSVVRPSHTPDAPASSDPATLIAQALKRKFANSHTRDSNAKDDVDWDEKEEEFRRAKRNLSPKVRTHSHTRPPCTTQTVSPSHSSQGTNFGPHMLKKRAGNTDRTPLSPLTTNTHN